MKVLKKQFDNLDNFPFDFIYQDRKGPNSELPDHFHDLYEVFYVHSGKGTVFIYNSFYVINEGDVFIIPSDMIHHTIPSLENPPTISALYFDTRLVQNNPYDHTYTCLDLFNLAKKRNEYKISIAPHYQKLVERLLCRIYNEMKQKQIGYQSAVVLWLNHILLSLTRLGLEQRPMASEDYQSGPKWMKDIINYIEENLHEQLSLKTLAQRAYVSQEHFSRVFKKTTGMNLIQYLNTKKVIKAKEMLLTTDQNIDSIAEEVGFQSTPHFYRIFKKNVRLTPSAYRDANTH